MCNTFDQSPTSSFFCLYAVHISCCRLRFSFFNVSTSDLLFVSWLVLSLICVKKAACWDSSPLIFLEVFSWFQSEHSQNLFPKTNNYIYTCHNYISLSSLLYTQLYDTVIYRKMHCQFFIFSHLRSSQSDEFCKHNII